MITKIIGRKVTDVLFWCAFVETSVERQVSREAADVRLPLVLGELITPKRCVLCQAGSRHVVRITFADFGAFKVSLPSLCALRRVFQGLRRLPWGFLLCCQGPRSSTQLRALGPVGLRPLCAAELGPGGEQIAAVGSFISHVAVLVCPKQPSAVPQQCHKPRR